MYTYTHAHTRVCAHTHTHKHQCCLQVSVETANWGCSECLKNLFLILDHKELSCVSHIIKWHPCWGRG